MANVGDRIKALRGETSLADLAASTGLDLALLEAVERGEARLSGWQMIQVANALETTMQTLMIPEADVQAATGERPVFGQVVKPRYLGGLELCQYCDTCYHPMMRFARGAERIFVCDDPRCIRKADEDGFEARPDLTPRR